MEFQLKKVLLNSKMYLENNNDVPCLRKLEVERTQTNATHHSNLSGVVGTTAITSEFDELILLDNFHRVADTKSERDKSYQNGQDCCVAFGEDFGPTPIQGSLKIPDGGVHIIGGKLGEAFIIFATDEDARRAMSRNGGVVKNLHVTLVLGSKTEMQRTLEMSRKTNKNPKHPAVLTSGDTSRSEMAKKGGNQNSVSKLNESYVQKYDKKDAYSNDVYVSCYGLPFNVTMEDMIQFFKGLDVTQVIFPL